MGTPLMVVLIALGSLAYGIGLFLFIRWMLARASGWSRLAERFAWVGDEPPPMGLVRRHVTGAVGPVNFKRTLTIGIDHQGLYLAAGRLVPRGARPLLVPWGEIRHERQVRLYWQRFHRLAIGAPRLGTVTLPDELYQAARPYLAPVGE